MSNRIMAKILILFGRGGRAYGTWLAPCIWFRFLGRSALSVDWQIASTRRALDPRFSVSACQHAAWHRPGLEHSTRHLHPQRLRQRHDESAQRSAFSEQLSSALQARTSQSGSNSTVERDYPQRERFVRRPRCGPANRVAGLATEASSLAARPQAAREEQTHQD